MNTSDFFFPVDLDSMIDNNISVSDSVNVTQVYLTRECN